MHDLSHAGVLAVLVLCAAHISCAQSLSNHDVNELVRKAHTTEQYARLELYYKERAKYFSEQERSEKKQMEESLKTYASSKYPSAYERSRGLWMYYSIQREQTSALAEFYKAKLMNGRDDATSAQSHADSSKPESVTHISPDQLQRP